MKTVGIRRPREPGPRWPTDAEAAFLNDPARPPLHAKPAQRVQRFRTHEAAQADREARERAWLEANPGATVTPVGRRIPRP